MIQAGLWVLFINDLNIYSLSDNRDSASRQAVISLKVQAINPGTALLKSSRIQVLTDNQVSLPRAFIKPNTDCLITAPVCNVNMAGYSCTVMVVPSSLKAVPPISSRFLPIICSWVYPNISQALLLAEIIVPLSPCISITPSSSEFSRVLYKT